MESTLRIRTDDAFSIFGTLNTSNSGKKSKLLIFVHGLTGNKDEHQYINAAPFFNAHGIDTFRFDLYSDEDNGRSLSDCNVKVHAGDLLMVINHFKDKYKELFLVGHSFGATVILHTDISVVKRVVLWDPTKGMESLAQKACVYTKDLGKYMLNWRMTILVNHEMVDDWMQAARISESIKMFTKPSKLIFAGNCDIYDGWKPFLKDVTVPNEVVVIPGATHVFIEEGTAERMYEETLKWVNTGPQ